MGRHRYQLRRYNSSFTHTQKKKVAINIILLCHYYRRHHYYRTIEQYRQSCRQRSAASRYSDRLVRVATSGGLAISALNARKADGVCDRSAVINFRTGLLQPRFVPPRRWIIAGRDPPLELKSSARTQRRSRDRSLRGAEFRNKISGRRNWIQAWRSSGTVVSQLFCATSKSNEAASHRSSYVAFSSRRSRSPRINLIEDLKRRRGVNVISTLILSARVQIVLSGVYLNVIKVSRVRLCL